MNSEMKFTKIASDELVEAILGEVYNIYNGVSDILDGFTILIDNINFAFVCVLDSGWDDQGKYQYSSTDYQLVSYNHSKRSYPTDDNILEYYDFIFTQHISKSGSYFSDFCFEYYKPEPYKLKEVIVPEVIIPEHTEIRCVGLNGRE